MGTKFVFPEATQLVRQLGPSATRGAQRPERTPCSCPAELLENIMKNAVAEEMQETLLLVAQLFETQPQQTMFPDKALKVNRL